MDSRPVMSATERFKALYVNAVERICVLEEQLELAQQRIAELEAEQAEAQEENGKVDKEEIVELPVP